MTSKTAVNPVEVEAIYQKLLATEKPDRVKTLLGGANTRSFIGLVAATEPPIKSPKTSGMGGRIKKLTHLTVYMGGAVNYGNIVKNRQEKLAKELNVDRPEGWEPAPRQWGERIPQTPFVQHKGKLYLECMVTDCHRVEYRLDNKPVDFAEVEPFLREKSTSSRQMLTVESPEGTDSSREVVWRTFALENIVQVSMNGKTYEF